MHPFVTRFWLHLWLVFHSIRDSFFAPFVTRLCIQIRNRSGNVLKKVTGNVLKKWAQKPSKIRIEMTPKTALNSALTSMPECSLNRMSSVARSALTKFCGISSFLAEVRFSKKYFPKTTLSAEIISVARLFFGFSNWSNVGSGPKNSIEAKETIEKTKIKIKDLKCN